MDFKRSCREYETGTVYHYVFFFLNGINHASSVEGTHTFFDLKPNTDYNITSRVVTTDNNNPSSYLERYVSHTTSTG